MSKQWHNEEIEKLLQQMPDVQDTRSKEDVFAKLKETGVFDDEVAQKPVIKKKKTRAPFYVAIAAAAVLAILPLLMWEDTILRESADESAKESSFGEAESASDMMDTRSLTTFAMQDRFAVYEEELATFDVIYGVRTDVEEAIIPTTVMKIQEGNPSVSSAASSDIALVEMYSEQVEALQMEIVEPFVNVQYVLYEEQGIRHFAINKKTYPSAKEAIEQLNNVHAPLISPIPVDVTYKVEEQIQTLTLTFDETFNFDSLEPIDAMFMIEAINLTASSFGKEVFLQNVEQMEWQGFLLNEPLPAVIGANRVYLE